MIENETLMFIGYICETGLKARKTGLLPETE